MGGHKKLGGAAWLQKAKNQRKEQRWAEESRLRCAENIERRPLTATGTVPVSLDLQFRARRFASKSDVPLYSQRLYHETAPGNESEDEQEGAASQSTADNADEPSTKRKREHGDESDAETHKRPRNEAKKAGNDGGVEEIVSPCASEKPRQEGRTSIQGQPRAPIRKALNGQVGLGLTLGFIAWGGVSAPRVRRVKASVYTKKTVPIQKPAQHESPGPAAPSSKKRRLN
ncbi:hypothetical protein K490DRAFT_55600 [Saccharata proteae CBS 121410]|uniref:Uncharacterized protein n=1 Tax=Saccharata proteae CBS 121410 TaxID=1314787 RepID=A0A6A5YB88_9PEZI|nr:hypothetical protein K490DRAFT_55600 [Saccharata proteae CBS 121410]